MWHYEKLEKQTSAALFVRGSRSVSSLLIIAVYKIIIYHMYHFYMSLYV